MRKNKTVPQKETSSFSKDDAYQTLSTINSWINSYDSKTSFALALLGILIGFMFDSDVPDSFIKIGEASKLSDLSCCDILSAIMIIGLYLSSLLSLISFMSVIIPRTKNPNNASSLFFFGAINSIPLKDYKKKLCNSSDIVIFNDLAEQIHTNSKICTQKSKWYTFGIRSLLITVILWFICQAFRLI